jgi:hypothetical protein
MIEIKLNSYQYNEQKNIYSVHLGGYVFKEFKQERQAKKFLVETSKVLTDSIRAINDLYRSVVSVSQSFVFSFRDARDISRYNELKSRIDERMYFIIHRYTGNQNAFVVKTIFYIANTLGDLIVCSLNASDKIKYTGFEYTFNGIQSQLDSISFKLRQLGNIDMSTFDYNYDLNILQKIS